MQSSPIPMKNRSMARPQKHAPAEHAYPQYLPWLSFGISLVSLVYGATELFFIFH